MTTMEAIRTGSNSVPGRSLPIARILFLEALLAGAAGAFLADTFWLAAALLVLAVVAAVLGLRRSGGVTWFGKRARAKRFAAGRKRVATVAAEGDTGLGALRALAPGLRVSDATHRGRTIGVASDGAGWFAAVDLAPGRGLDGNRHAEVPVGRLAELLVADHLPVTAIQILATTVPAPAPGAETGSPCRRSYLNLLADRPIVADHSLRVIARMSGSDAASAAAARGGGFAGVQRALAAALGRVVATLSSVGCAAEALDAGQLGTALLDSLYPAGFDPGQEAVIEEQWQAWHGKTLAHRTWRVTGRPSVPLSEVHDRLAHTGAQTIVTSLTLRKDAHGGEPTSELLIRLVMPAAESTGGADRLGPALRSVGLSAEPVDGRQGAATYASAPTAGSL